MLEQTINQRLSAIVESSSASPGSVSKQLELVTPEVKSKTRIVTCCRLLRITKKAAALKRFAVKIPIRIRTENCDTLRFR